jgi:hypothetical protein
MFDLQEISPPCDNGLWRMQFIFRIIMNTIPKCTVGQVLGVFHDISHDNDGSGVL